MGKIDISTYNISYSDKFFFDTNIWLLLFGTIANFQKKEQMKYSSFFAELLIKDKPIFITSLVVSEFSNVLLRRDFNQWVQTNKFHGKEFKKDYVGTIAYKNSVNSIKVLLNKILALPNLVRIGDSFNALNFQNIFNDFESIDFNDSYYTEVCLINDYKMISNDKDLLLVSNKIDVITAL